MSPTVVNELRGAMGGGEVRVPDRKIGNPSNIELSLGRVETRCALAGTRS